MAAVRETEEEVLVTPKNCIRQLIFLCIYRRLLSSRHNFCLDLEGVPGETDEADPFWVDEKNLPFEEMWQDDALWLPLVLEGNTYLQGSFLKVTECSVMT